MIQTVLVSFILLLLVIIPSNLFACFSPSNSFVAAFVETPVDRKELESLCIADSCINGGYSTIIRSFGDSRIALGVSENGLNWVLPYKIVPPADSYVEDGVTIEGFNVKKLVSSDIDALQSLGIIALSDEQKRQILDLATFGQHIGICDGQMMAWYVGDTCVNGEILTPRCGGDGVEFTIPKVTIR